VAVSRPQLGEGPSQRFNSQDIATMIESIGATGDAARELYKQFAGLEGYRSQSASNAVGAIAGFSGIGAGYGCWCYFGADHLERRAKGPPLDPLDDMCHALSRGYECATIDVDGCVPWEVDYSTANALADIGDTEADIATMCEAENTSKTSCQYMACTIEQWWLKQVAINPAGGNLDDLINPLHKHSDAGWEALREASCVGPAVGQQRQIECCGLYPARYPFNTLAPNKICCEDTTGATPVQTSVYNTAYEQCCPDGLIRSFGETC